MKPPQTKGTRTKKRTVASSAIMLAIPAVLLAFSSPAAASCDYQNYGIVVQVGDWECESNDDNSVHQTYCNQDTGGGAGGGAGGPGSNKVGVESGVSADCDGSGGLVEKVSRAFNLPNPLPESD